MKPTLDNQSNPIDFIRQLHPFDHLDDPELDRIDKSVETVHFPIGTYILTQGGQQSQHLYIIVQGSICLMRDGQVIQVLEEGEFFGYPSMINSDAPSFDVIAEEVVWAYRIPEKVFYKLIDNVQFSEFFLKSLSERLRQLSINESLTLGGELTTPVGELIVRPPIQVSPLATVAEAAQAMRRAWVNVALVTSKPLGIVTDSDFLIRVLAEELGPETRVNQVMSQPLKSLPVDTPVHEALFLMLEENIHHLALTDQNDVVGIVTATDILRHQAKSPLYLMRHLESLSSPEELSHYGIEVAGAVDKLFNGGLDIGQIGRIVASLNDALIRRLLRLAEQDLGAPPTPYAWIVFGSEGRMEQALLTDQDNALVYLDTSEEAQQYFDALAEQVIDNLIKAGFPPCPGGYMATNWCRPLDSWIDLFKGWIKKPDSQALLESAIFFDFRAVYGPLSLEPLEEVVLEAGNDNIFLARLARAAMRFRPPLGFFRRILAEDGFVDLKAGGIAPIVSMARVYAIEAQTRARSTLERLEDAAEKGTLSRNGAETLSETYRFLLKLRLRDQLEAVQRSETPDNKIRLQSLSPRENHHLKDAFLAIREMQESLSQRFQTDLLG